MRRTPPHPAAPDQTLPWLRLTDRVPTQRSDRGTAYTSPDGSQWSWDGEQWAPILVPAERPRWWRSRPALVTASAVLVLGLGGWILTASQQPGGPTPAELAAVRGVLQSAGMAQLAHHAENHSYAPTAEDLIGSGAQLDRRVTLTVVSATESAFCLAAGPPGRAPIAWLTQDGESATSCV